MKDMEIISFEQVNDNKYIEAICMVRFDGKHIQNFVLTKFQDGGKKWGPMTSTILKPNGEKKYIKAYMHSDRLEDDKIFDYIGFAYKNQNVQTPVAMSAPLGQGMVKTAFQAPASAEVAVDEPLPF